ncbi:MAG: sortase [Actinobacteria bacterium]|nr:sortase [Actinomycetota bacterium]
MSTREELTLTRSRLRGRPGLFKLGLAMVAAGVLILEFTAYLFFGTDLVQSHSQKVLTQVVDYALPAPLHVWNDASPVPIPSRPGPAQGEPLGRIIIPAIHLNQVVLQGRTPGILSAGPGHYPGTAMPGEAGNVAIAGHRTTWGRPFWALADLKADDKIILATPRGRFLYRVRSETVVDPHDVSVLGQAVPAPSLTLTTCTPKFSAAQRLILTASLASEQVVQPSAVKTIRTLPWRPGSWPCFGFAWDWLACNCASVFATGTITSSLLPWVWRPCLWPFLVHAFGSVRSYLRDSRAQDLRLKVSVLKAVSQDLQNSRRSSAKMDPWSGSRERI